MALEHDGVPLTSMTTKQLSALARAKGVAPQQSRAAFLNALADALTRDDDEGLGDDARGIAREGETTIERARVARRTTEVTIGRGGATTTTATTRAGRVNEFGEEEDAVDGANAFDGDDDEDEDGYEDEEGYFVGTAAFVWEDEVYTYGGLAHEGEFVTSVYRWSGRGACYEVAATAADGEVGVPPGRYGHGAVVHGDLLYVFGGQGQFGCLNDLWVFDFVACTWTLVDVIGDPPPSRTGHCMCISDNVLFVFAGKDVQPGQDVVIYNDLYGFDLAESEWLTIDTQWKHPVGGDACAMAARNSTLYILSPNETSIEMVVWVLQLSAAGTPRWTMVARAGQVPSPRTSFLSCVYGANWIVHGGRVLLQDDVLGDTYVFHFPTAEWARLNPESDTDPRFSHAGACVDGALVILHGSRDPSIRASPEEAGVCIAINLEAYLPFPTGEEESELNMTYTGKIPQYDEGDEEGGAVATRGEGKELDEAVQETEIESNLEQNILTQLNERGVYGSKGGLLGGSLHVPIKGSHDTGDLEFIVGDCKIFAHTEVVREGSKYLAELMEKSPMTAALERKPDAMKITQHYYRYLGSIMALLVRALYCFFVVVSFTVRRMVSPEKDSMKRIVITDSSVPVVLAALRWIYQIPVHPQADMLLELYELAKRLKIDGLPGYCIDRMRKELNVKNAAAAAKIASLSRNAPLWKAAVKIGQQQWNEVSHTDSFRELEHSNPSIAQDYALAIHESVVLPGHKGFGSHAA